MTNLKISMAMRDAAEASISRITDPENPQVTETARSVIYDNVQISPCYIKFTEASEGITCRQRITIKNTGSRMSFVRIREPNSIAFEVQSLKNGVMLNPGLSVSTIVTYSFKRPSILRATIPIEINGKTIDYRVICSLAMEGISIEPKSIDFGTIDIGYSSGIRIITIKNVGGKSTRFSIDLGANDLEISVNPLRAICRPNRSVELRVELIGLREGVFYSEFWIKSYPNIRVPLKVNIIVPRLVLHHPNTTGDFTLIDFPPTVENTKRYDTFVLQNVSSQVASYVVLGEIGNEVESIRDIDREKYPFFDAFEIRPIQGRMDPFEGVIFQIGFTPISKLMRWRQNQKQQSLTDRRIEQDYPENDFMAFIRIVKVHGTETEDILRVDPVKDTLTEEASSCKTITHDAALLDISSSSTSSSSTLEMGKNEVVKLCLHGEVETAKLYFVPDTLYFGDLNVGDISQRVICISHSLKFAPLTFRYVRNASARCYPESAQLKPGSSLEVLIKVKGKESISSSFTISFDVIVDSIKSMMERRVIKALIGKYSIKCYVNIVVKSKPQKRVRKCLQLHNILPPPSTLVPIQPEALTASEVKIRARHRLYWATRFRKIFHSKKPTFKSELDDDDEVIKRMLRTPKWSFTDTSQLCSTKIEKSLVARTKAEVLIPLSPLQIYNVHIFPTMFTFGMVAPKSHTYKQLIIENNNNFPVMIRFISLSNSIRFPQGNLIILSPGLVITRLIEFRRERVGKFNGYVDYVINDNHSFELNVTADVVHKILSVDRLEVVFGNEWFKEEMYHPIDAHLQIRNKLDAKTCFKWDIPPTCGFFIETSFGSVRGNSSLYTYMHYKPEDLKANYTEVIMKCESSSFTTVRLSVQAKITKVAFLNDVIDAGEIPLNLRTKQSAVLRNMGFVEVLYEVDTSSLVHGCDVQPLRGVISPRGIAILNIYLTIDVCCQFATVIRVIVQKKLHPQLKIVGCVSFPRLKLLQAPCDLKRINADAYQMFHITASNVGSVVLKLNFPLKEYPEFHISLSRNKKDRDINNEDILMPPGTSLNLYLHFEPVDLACYFFYLPIVINDILGPAVINHAKTLRASEYLKQREEYYQNLTGFNIQTIPQKLPTVSIDCTVAGHVVTFNKLFFQFDVSTDKVEDVLIIENRDSLKEMTVQIEINNFSTLDSPFSINWSDGAHSTITATFIECTLKHGERTVFTLEFLPRFRGNFNLEAPITVVGELKGQTFNILILEGKNPGSSIVVENPEIYLSPVPLSTAAEKRFWLHIKNFENPATIITEILTPEIHYGVYQRGSLFVQYPYGNDVPAQNSKLRVHLIFKSDQPVSLRSKIKFYDETKLNVCRITVYATTDNNLLTTHTYSRKSISDFRKMNDFDYGTFYRSTSTPNASEEEEYNEDQKCSFWRTHRQDSAANISIHSFFEVLNKGKFGKLLDSKNDVLKDEYITDVNETTHDNDIPRECQDEVELGNQTNELSDDSIDTPLKTRKQPAKLEYPFYPVNDSNTGYEAYMNKTLKAAEEWLYSGPFKFSFYPNIPNGITASLTNLLSKDRRSSNTVKRKNYTFGMSFVDVLASLIGSQVYDHIGKPEPLAQEDVERVEYVLRLYDRILDFLRKQGAFLTHVSSCFFLSYNDYLVMLNSLENNCQQKRILEEANSVISKEKWSVSLFESRSKQCWLDLILQTYKCFVLARVSDIRFKRAFSSFYVPFIRRSSVLRESYDSSNAGVPKQYEIYDKAIRHILQVVENQPSLNNHSVEETLLLSWLQYHYDEERVHDWMTDRRVILNPHESKDIAGARVIDNFDDNLIDSLALITVTGAYCPFLIDEYFNNMYICPRNFGEVLHNAVCVVKAWRKIRLGFVVTPLDIARPNCIKMLMLVTHLFELLPTYLPRNKVTFSCPLTETVTREISFTNITSFSVGFLMVFIGNDGGLFKIIGSDSIVQLNGHESILVKIEFHARKIRKFRAYLLFCGSVIGPHFGRNQTFILEGQANTLEIAKEYVIRSKLYQIVEKNLGIRSPYTDAAEYEIMISEERPTTPSTLKMVKWSELCTRKIPRRLFLNQATIKINENEDVGSLSISLACIAPVHRSFWLILQSKSGDFIIEIKSLYQVSLNDPLVLQWSDKVGACICTDPPNEINKVCPYNVDLSIPMRNVNLWTCVAQMFQKTLDPKERLFWSRYLDTYIGLRLIRWLMGDYTDSAALEFLHIFDKTVVYNVTSSDKSSPIKFPETFTIDDVSPQNKNCSMRVHISPSTAEEYETTLSLTSLDGKELRLYNITFMRI